MTIRFPLLAAAIALAGCASEEGFPSLALRPAERDVSPEEPMRPSPAVVGDPALRRQAEELQREAREGERAFEAAHPAAERAVAAAGTEGSDSWVEAQQALSRLESEREPTMRALARLDQLAMSRVEVPTSEADFAAINAAVAAVERLAVGQQERLDRLRARLSRR